MPKDTWRNLPEDKRRSITQAAMAEFGARGFSSGSLNVIAREAGIAKGSLFQYFEDKLDFFATVTEAMATGVEAAAIEGIDLEAGRYFDSIRTLVANWLRYYRAHPHDQRMAHAAASEIDDEARAAVRGVPNKHYVNVLRPAAQRAAARGELRPDADIDQLVAMTVLLLRHLNSAPFQPHLDPVLGLYEKSPKQVDKIARELVDALERAYGISP
jgi:AcrR family transcriptional regulator